MTKGLKKEGIPDDSCFQARNGRNGTEGTMNTDGTLTSADYYFDSYAHQSIHEEMLKDTVRTCTYRDAILRNKHLFREKIVLDVGCGTGILSMFAAQAGAAKVIGVDCSTVIIHAKKIIETNGFKDKIVLIKGKIEEVDLPFDKVDIIISEWMGYALLYESMLDSVLFARDKWLVEGGLMFPDKANLYLAGIVDYSHSEDKQKFWGNVYSFKMNSILEKALIEPVVKTVNDDEIITSISRFKTIDLKIITKKELSFNEKFSTKCFFDESLHGFVIYFDVVFSDCHKPMTISTGPYDQYTHWKQTTFFLRKKLTVCTGDDVNGEISCKPNEENHRDLAFCFKYVHRGVAYVESFKMW